MGSVSHAERVDLADKAYLQQGKTEVEDPAGWVIKRKGEKGSGLEIYAMLKEGTNEVVFVVRGTDGSKDWGTGGPNASHITGKLHEQDKEALTFVDAFLAENTNPDGTPKYHYTVAGDSKGGAIAQIISHTFRLAGTTTDPAAGGGVVKSDEYKDFVRHSLITVSGPKGVPPGQLVNIREAGSPVTGASALSPGVDHLGVTVTLDFVKGKLSDILHPLDALTEQHTNRENRIIALEKAGLSAEIDPFFIVVNDTIAAYSTQKDALQKRLARLPEEGEYRDREESEEVKNIENQLHFLHNDLNDLLGAKNTIIKGTYGDANGYVDPWVQKLFMDVSSTNPHPDFQSMVDVVTPHPFHVENDVANTDFTGFGKEQQEADNPIEDPEVFISAAETVSEQTLGQAGSPSTTEEAEYTIEEEASANRAADLAIMQSGDNLLDAIRSGDELESVTAGLGYLSKLEDNADQGVLSESNEAIIDIIGSTIGLAQSIDEGNRWGIVTDSIDLLQDIDNYLHQSKNEYSDIISDSTSRAFGIGTAGIGLGMAIDSGDDWAVAQSSIQLLEGIDIYLGGGSSTLGNTFDVDAGAAFKSAASVLGLAMNITSLDDVFDSGDAGDIGYALASTAHNAINTYNAAASVTNLSSVGGNVIPGLGFIAAGALLTQGNYVGAAASAASAGVSMSVAAGMMSTGVGAIAGMALMAVNLLLSDDDPPEATADFILDANGNVVMGVHGDKEMRETAGNQGHSMIALMQEYKDSGGRILIDGHLPSLTVVQGEGSSLNYYSETGGHAAVVLSDSINREIQVRGVLLARDRGERLDSAVRVGTNDFGDIDLSRVDALMAGHGFKKNGITYTYGEVKERMGFSTGSGVFQGGGNDGPEGHHFVAKASDVTSLPLRPDQLPRQKMGEILKIVGLNNMFSGAGSELLAMAMVYPGGLLGLASKVHGQETVLETVNEYIKPLNGFERDAYLQGHLEFAQLKNASNRFSRGIAYDVFSDPLEMEKFVSNNWSYLASRSAGSFPDTRLDNSFHYCETINYNTLLSDGSLAAWSGRVQSDTFLEEQLRLGTIDEEYFQAGAKTFSGRRLLFEHITDSSDIKTEISIPSGVKDNFIENEVVFVVAENASLRFISEELLGNGTSGTYSTKEEGNTFVAFGKTTNGRVYQETNGDIRFEPDPGFVGTGSFQYTIMTASGQLVKKYATVIVNNVNDAPILQDDHFALNEGETFYLDQLLGNDKDSDGDTLMIDHFTGVKHGDISLLNGRLAFIPEDGFFGDAEFFYWVRDHADSYPVMANVVLRYSDVDQGVFTEDDRFLIVEDSSLNTSVDKLLKNDVEHDGQSMIFTALGAASHGSVRLASDGVTILFTPDQNYTGTEAGFSYSVQDDSGYVTTGWAAVEVIDSREPPEVIATTRQPIMEDEILTFSPDEVAKIVSDADGDHVYFDMITNVSGGTIVSQNGYYSFVPDRDYSGLASFDYRANDNHRGTVNGHLEFEIIAVNDIIDTGTDLLLGTEDQKVTTNIADLLANDSDADGIVFDFISLGNVFHGSVVAHADGNIVFTPERDYFGDLAGFEYIVRDSEGLDSTGSVEIQMEGVNDAPVSTNKNLSSNEDQPIVFDAATLSLLLQDADQDVLTVTDVVVVSGGTVSRTDGHYIFHPDSDYHGVGSVMVTVEDALGESLSRTVDIEINAVDDQTVFSDQLLTVQEDQFVTMSSYDLLSGAADIDGELEFLGLGNVYYGAVSSTGQGEITFTPDADYFGTGAGFEYLVKDTLGGLSTGFVTIYVESVNDPPQIITDRITILEDQQLVFSEETISRFINDLDNDVVALTAIDSVFGDSILEPGGLFSFTPENNYHGPASLHYSATDGNGHTITDVLYLDILAVDDPTHFGDDLFITQEEQLLVASVAELIANDSDVDGNGGLQFIGLGAAIHGRVRLLADDTVEFMPNTDYFGDDAGFSYIVRDAEGTESAGWVTVKVENINDVPEIIANRLHINEDESITFSKEEVAKFLTDRDGDLMQLDVVSGVQGGRITQSSGVFTFIPDEDFYGEASFEYLAKNSSGEEVTGQLTFAISPINDLPETLYVAASGIEDNEIQLAVGDLMAGARDVEDGTDLRFGGIDSSLHGDVYVDSQNIIHFLPDNDFYGSGFFRYNVLDSEGGVSLGYVGIDLTGENDIPVAVDDDSIVAWSNNSYENIFSAATFLGNDYDVDQDTLKIVTVEPAECGTVSVDGAGNIRYTAHSDDWVGIDSFIYTISDGNGGFAEAEAVIDVKINTSPDAYSELIFTREDIISILSQEELLANDSDIDGDSMQIIGVDQAEHCNATLLGDGSIQFTPELNFNNLYPGQASFRYTVSDGISDPVTAIAFFDIDPINDKPILRAERISGAVEDNSFSFRMAKLMANDTDVEMSSPYEEDFITPVDLWGAAHGSISWNQNTGTIFYVPEPNFCGIETFYYKVIDSHGAESVMQSEIYVLPVNDFPLVQEDVGSTAEDSIWNHYSIADLVSNDFDVDGDTLSIKNPYLIEGIGNVRISGGNLDVQPSFGEDRVVIGYTVSDGNGGEVLSRLTINDIREHNFAPTFSGLYQIAWKDSSTVWFNFHAEDRNGGNTWGGDWGDIVSLAPSAPNTGSLTQDGTNIGTSTWKFKGDVQNAALTFTVVDQSGATGTIFIRMSNLSQVSGMYHYSPVVFDLDGDGVELVGLDAGVGFDWDLDGEAESTGWVGEDDGFLVYDYNQDRVITKANELALKEYNPEANTDLEGLLAFDTNNDGLFDAKDEEWEAFGIWQDKNSNGVTDDGEYSTLDELHIASVDLQSDHNFREVDGSVIYGETTYETTDGRVGIVGDVGLNGESIELDATEPAQTKESLAAEETQEDVAITASEQNNETEVAGEPGVSVHLLEPEPEDSSETSDPLGIHEATLDEAELNRTCDQLVSDMAVSNDDEPLIEIVTGDEPVYCLDNFVSELETECSYAM